MKRAHQCEYGFIAMNVLATLPFVGTWWMAVPQFMWTAIKVCRLLTGGQRIDETQIFKSEVYMHHRKW